MATLRVSAERNIGAPALDVYRYIADFREHHWRWLPKEFSDFQVESGGYGAGTVNNFTVTLGGRPRRFHTVAEEPEPGRVLTETDAAARTTTTFTVEPEGNTCRVRIGSEWESAAGMMGIIEGLLAPRMMRGLYLRQLDLLDRYAREQAKL